MFQLVLNTLLSLCSASYTIEQDSKHYMYRIIVFLAKQPPVKTSTFSQIGW